MSSPVNAAQQARLNAQIASLPPELRAAIVAAGIQDARAILPVPYWSTVRFTATVAANTATIAAGTIVKAFQYAAGQTPTVAGTPAATATFAETNLLRAGETLDNADVWIYGIAAEICNNSEPVLAAQIWRNAFVELSLNGTQSMRLATLPMLPSAGGLYGSGQSALALPPLPNTGFAATDGGTGSPWAMLANGNPMGGNFFRCPQPFKWCGVGTGGVDASLSINTTIANAISIPLAATRASGAGVGQWTQPTTGQPGTVVDIRFRLISVSVARRSVNT